jgi:hypothetical protein
MRRAPLSADQLRDAFFKTSTFKKFTTPAKSIGIASFRAEKLTPGLLRHRALTNQKCQILHMGDGAEGALFAFFTSRSSFLFNFSSSFFFRMKYNSLHWLAFMTPPLAAT